MLICGIQTFHELAIILGEAFGGAARKKIAHFFLRLYKGK
jgi:hypothetical protein